MVQNVHIWRYSAIGQLITKAMYSHRFIVDAKLSVALALTSQRFTSPLPTIISTFLINFSPKSIFRGTIQYITMSPPPFIVHKTPAVTGNNPVTLFNLADAAHVPILPQPVGVF